MAEMLTLRLPKTEIGVKSRAEKKIAKEEAEEKPTMTIESLIDFYFLAKPFNKPTEHELEVKFKSAPIRRTDYDNVIKKLLSLGFYCGENTGDEVQEIYSLRIFPTIAITKEKIKIPKKEQKPGSVRVEIEGLTPIRKYCDKNDIKNVYYATKFNQKKQVKDATGNNMSVVNGDFNFKVTYSTETLAEKGLKYAIENSWEETMKTYRFINRVTFKHNNYPVKVDISIVKSSKNIDRRDPETFEDTSSSGVFNAVEKYEIEIEIDNTKIGDGTVFDTSQKLLIALKKVIKFVLSGIQKTNYPIGFPEQRLIFNEYNRLFPKKIKEKKESKPVFINFVGPNPVTLQLENVHEKILDRVPNIRNNYVVTDKADGERSFLYIAESGKIYLISNDMVVRFTGSITTVKDMFNTLLDGELVSHDDENNVINLYAAFDLYFYHGLDYRKSPLIGYVDDKGQKIIGRYNILQSVVSKIEIQSSSSSSSSSRLTLKYKIFLPLVPTKGTEIFGACKKVLANNKSAAYKTDGLIFTPAYLCVYGSTDVKCDEVPNKSVRWPSTFKWKPPIFNTVDFLVRTVKTDDDRTDQIFHQFSSGINTKNIEQEVSYKKIELKVSCSGVFNPCENILQDNYNVKSSRETFPLTFVPSSPSDSNGGICIINLDDDMLMRTTPPNSNEDKEVFKDNMIVEFSYDKEQLNWVPIKVRHDKTNIMLNMLSKSLVSVPYGNSYEVAESNWKSIHCPVTEAMLVGDEKIGNDLLPKNMYYINTDRKNVKSQLRSFHNYYKSRLINSVSKATVGHKTLIDYACGVGGDIKKWNASNIKFVLGIDLFENNIVRRGDGACARYVDLRREQETENVKEADVMGAIFIQGNSSKNIKNGEAFDNDSMSEGIIRVLFGDRINEKEATQYGKGVAKYRSFVDKGFDISSCQFALHYFFKDINTLRGFVTNLAECTKLGGYFIGTAYDGKEVYKKLKRNKGLLEFRNEEDNGLILQIDRNYSADDDIVDNRDPFLNINNSTSLGMEISVFQDSIGQHFVEYLINFDYFNNVMRNFGFVPLSPEEASRIGLPIKVGGIGSFNKLREQFSWLKANNKAELDNYYANELTEMSQVEQNISSLSSYFVYQKIAQVVPSDVVLEHEEEEVISPMVVEEKEKEKEQQPKITKLKGHMELTEDVQDVSLEAKKRKSGKSGESGEIKDKPKKLKPDDAAKKRKSGETKDKAKKLKPVAEATFVEVE